MVGKSGLSSKEKHHFWIAGFLIVLGLILDLAQISLGTSTHSSVGTRRGTSLVMCLEEMQEDQEEDPTCRF